MKALLACIFNETNTFSVLPVGRKAFEAKLFARKALSVPPVPCTTPLQIWREKAAAKSWTCIDSLGAWAQPAGMVSREIFEECRDIILADVARERPDIVMLSMHGAMVADGYDDCEGDLMARIREILGREAIISLEIDPHCHLTPLMLEAATLIVCFKEYPHTDVAARAHDLFQLTADAAEGLTKPVMRDFDCRMVSMYPTQGAVMRVFVDDMLAAEGQNGILSLSLAHGFPYGDTADTGTRMLAIADGNADLAQAAAEQFGKRLWDSREALRINWPDIPTALDRAEAATEFPVVLADTGDNAGGGAPSDSTFVLQEVLARGMKDVALAVYWDPVLVDMCCDAGVGARMRVRLGGKRSVTSGEAVDLDVTVRAIRHDMVQKFGDLPSPFGTGVWLDANGVHLVINNSRTQCLHPSLFTDLGIDLAAMRAIVVKSSNHFYAGFAPIASEVIHIASPGTLTADFAAIPYTRRAPDYWPRVENPFADTAS
ncbi:MAG: M81 family peptidase [Rhodobacteraceae bacterium]|nr:M81 family peptidase [Paracoccaceae bacterium]